ncbi:MAG: FmdB family zinc ribbon protein [Gammaproteobacteria bacterium]
MPIYEYQCCACGHHLEALQKLREAPLKQCPNCHRPELRKLVSAARFRLKGTGWYETDFKTAHRHNVLNGGDRSAPDGKAQAPVAANTIKGEKPKSAKAAAKPAPSSKPAAANSA